MAQQDLDLPSPSCPLCGAEMEIRQNQHGAFWGCIEYPDCRGLIPVPSPRARRPAAVRRRAVRERQLTPSEAALLREHDAVSPPLPSAMLAEVKAALDLLLGALNGSR